MTLAHRLVVFSVLCMSIAFAESRQNVSYIYPRPHSCFVSNDATVIIRMTENIRRSSTLRDVSFDVKGDKSGNHSGKVIFADRGTIIFKPERRFAPGERVQVKCIGSFLRNGSLEFHFTTSALSSYEENFLASFVHTEPLLKESTAEQVGEMTVINGVSVPSDFPRVRASVLKQTAPGRIFLNNWVGSHYFMILENNGTPYFYQRVPEQSRDFKLQPTGMLTRRNKVGTDNFYGMDSSYTVVDTFQCTHGYYTDEHDLVITPDHHYFLIGRDEQRIDMSKNISGGKKKARVIGNHVQEFDENDNLIFEWRSWDHFNITDAVHENLKADRIDYVHMNSVAVDYDDNIIISSRHLSEITKIDRETGDIIWRLGGENNQFKFINDELNGPSYQHHARPVSGKPNHYTIFDNGNHHKPSVSRAVEYKVDTEEMTATQVWEYRHHPDRHTWWMGNAQRLPNGNTLINWADGSLPKATEVTPDGDVVYEADFISPSHCYRTFRFQWQSAARVPYLIAESHSDKVTLIFNKFGDPDVEHYIVYGGLHAHPTTAMDTTSQPYLHLRDLQNHRRYYFRVTAVNSDGKESGFSNEQDVLVKYIKPGTSQVLNGEFDFNTKHWYLNESGGARANGRIHNGEYHLNIADGGSHIWNVQLRQEGIELVRGETYLFEFDARALQNRQVDAKLERSGSPWENYGRIGTSWFRTKTEHFAYEFEMKHQTDYEARIVFNCGISDVDVFIDNVSVTRVVESDVKSEQSEPTAYALHDNYPNPFNPTTTIRYSVPELSRVAIQVYNIVGEHVDVLTSSPHKAGTHTITFNASDLTSGVYFYRMTAKAVQNNRQYERVKKFTVMK